MMINLKWLWRTLPRWELLLILVLALPSSLENAVNGWTIGHIPVMAVSSRPVLVRYLILALSLYVGTYALTFVFQFIMQDVIRRANIALKETILQRSLQVGENQSTGLNRVTGDAVQIKDQYFDVLVNILRSVCTAVSCAWLVFTTNWQMGLIYIGFSFLAMLPMAWGAKFLARLGQRWSTANAKTVAAAKNWLAGRIDIIQYQAEKPFFKFVRQALQLSEKRQQEQTNGEIIMQTVSALFATIGFFTPLIIGLIFIQKGLFGVTAAVLLTLLLTADGVSFNVRAVVMYWSQLASTKELRQLPSATELGGNAVAQPLDATVKLIDATVDLDQHNIIASTTLTVSAGMKTLISGPSGSGKSTLLTLLAGLRLPTTGKVKVGQIEATPTSTTYITQQPWLVNGTVRDNLTLGQEFTDADLNNVLSSVGLVQELGNQPLERQINADQSSLSGGQTQRLMIARGLLRKRGVLLLDEITAGLDDANATSIRNLIYQLPNTVIEVAHHYDEQQLRANGVKHYQLTATHTLQPVD